MARGSTFTLYRAYNNFKMDDGPYAALLKAYREHNEKHDFGILDEPAMDKEEYKKLRERKERDWSEDVPLVMSIGMGDVDSIDDESDHEGDTLEDFRKRNYSNYVLKGDRRFCDKILEWNFISTFDCLIEHFNLSYYNYKDNSVIITADVAKEMLSAIEYLLCGKWDDVVEMAMNNPWIKVFSEGGNCDSYWKYVYRKRSPEKTKTYRFSDGGIDVRVTVRKASEKKDDEEDSERYMAELDESNEAVEFHLRNTANALRAFLESDNWSYKNETELVLVYSAWG